MSPAREGAHYRQIDQIFIRVSNPDFSPKFLLKNFIKKLQDFRKNFYTHALIQSLA